MDVMGSTIRNDESIKNKYERQMRRTEVESALDYAAQPYCLGACSRRSNLLPSVVEGNGGEND